MPDFDPTKQKISVILPCFNEKDNILPLIEEIHKNLEPYKHEILIVDDNSPDGTYQLVKEKKLPYVRAILRKTDPSFAKSIRTGLEKAKGKILIVMDSDFNHKPEVLPALVENLRYYDCVLASRFVYGGDMGNRVRHICSWLFNVATRIVTRTFVTDTLFGYFAIRRDVIEKVDYDKVFWGFGEYNIRLMYYLQRQRISILQIPGVLGQRRGGEGNSRFFKTFMIYTKAVLKLVWDDFQDRRAKQNGLQAD